MQIDYIKRAGDYWQRGDLDDPLAVARFVCDHVNGVRADGHTRPIWLSIGGEKKPVHALRFPVTGEEWDVVNGFRRSIPLVARPWVWQLAGAVLALVILAAWYLLA